MRSTLFRGGAVRRAGSLALVLALIPSLVPVAVAQERTDFERRAETLKRMQAKYPNVGFRDEPGVPATADAPAFGADSVLAAVPPTAQDRILAGHLLRRISFGPTPAEVNLALRTGRANYVKWQLYGAIDDTPALRALPPLPTGERAYYDDAAYIRRWYTRMVYSRRQLLERMTLIWHEHFATSNEKVGAPLVMYKQENFLRSRALVNFRDLLLGITTDQAMLLWLDNNYNNGNKFDRDGNRILPNANYAREFLQLFSMGPVQLNMDGTPIVDANNVPLPSYTEDDIKAVARAFTGWKIDDYDLPGRLGYRFSRAFFLPRRHDATDKTIFGVTIKGRPGPGGALEVTDVVNLVMKQPSVAPFISKMLIQKLATETPTPGYVQRVATVFQTAKGDIRKVLTAILNDPEFVSDAVVRTQFKEPIEHFVGPARALSALTRGGQFIDWTYTTRQLLYYPPSVFSFYPPGQKRTLVNTALVTYRDRGADDFASGYTDTRFDPAVLKRRYRLTTATPTQIVDFLADALLVAPLSDDIRTEIVSYMDGRVDDEKFRGAVWLIMCSPDFQRN
jgi:uncharacterized protein (DUF1800 family)